MIMKEVSRQRMMLPIDRRKPFDPGVHSGSGWSVSKEDADQRSVVLPEIDLHKLRLETTLRDGEVFVLGEEKLRRLKESKLIRLDSVIFLTLWETPEVGNFLVDHLADYQTDTSCLFLDGEVILGPDNRRYVLYLRLYRYGWTWGCRWLNHQYSVYHPSLVLEA